VANESKHRHPESDVRTSEEKVVELREEELEARKKIVETGKVRSAKDVVEELRTLEVPVTREEVTIERRRVEDRPASGQIGDDEVGVSVPVREDRVNVEKRTVVTEEIGVGKQKVQETERVSGTVRREEVRVDKEGDVRVDKRP